MTPTLWWIRRDLRLTDNLALAAALAAGDQVIPVFVIDPRLVDSADVSKKRLAFLFDGLRSLDAALQARGSRLLVRRGDPVEELCKLAGESGATG
ncbi:MAG TPA: deoxyribodipyrimidine photo-lyase, partial [Denitromonas sp.]|nr:deoxyribodipyrimidine photo-lyase [Denitromonas sp.]